MRNEIKDLGLPLPLGIVNLGASGASTLELLIAAGIPRSEIVTFDEKRTADVSSFEDLLRRGPRSLCVSPGYPLGTPWLAEFRRRGGRVTSELEIAFAFRTDERVIAITGSVGKSTTTSMIGAGAVALDPHAFVGGNLGTPLARYALGLIEGKPKAKHLILELSSYQLENFGNLRADVGVLTYLSPNHLERYDSLHEYYTTKLTLFARATCVVGNVNGGDAIKYLRRPEAIWVRGDDLKLDKSPRAIGKHNLDNLALAFAVMQHLQFPPLCFEEVLKFPGLPHRLENLGVRCGVTFINDSKSTTMDSVVQAVHSVREYARGNLILLLGGRDKNLPWEELSRLSSISNLKPHFFGEVGRVAQARSQLGGSLHDSLSKCLLHIQPQTGDLVLLSPGGTSFDEFSKFEERGDFFRGWVLSEFKDR